jgi:hypothetical protein
MSAKDALISGWSMIEWKRIGCSEPPTWTSLLVWAEEISGCIALAFWGDGRWQFHDRNLDKFGSKVTHFAVTNSPDQWEDAELQERADRDLREYRRERVR